MTTRVYDPATLMKERAIHIATRRKLKSRSLHRRRTEWSEVTSWSRSTRCALAFDATVRMSPMAYLRLMRVERMTRLLVSTDLSVSEIARAIGWTDPNYASRCFHAHYGVSPTEYRRRQPAQPAD